MAAELHDAGLERQARAGRGTLEDQRDDLARQRVRRPRRGLQRGGPREQLGELSGLEFLAGEEMSRQVGNPIPMEVLTWNLFHGRAQPPAGRDLVDDFGAVLTSWAWDVALLQEVPPWWPERLALATGATDHRVALTSRNAVLPLRRALARRWPDAMKSGGGGANAILVRGGRIADHRVCRLRRWPERRVVHAVALSSGPWVANLHAQVHSDKRACADIEKAATAVLGWADDAAVVLGGDLNVRDPGAVPGFRHAGGHGVDHVLVRGLRPIDEPSVLDRGPLSDHAPVLVELRV